MNRRTFLVTLPAAAAALSLRPEPAVAQDLEFVRAWERAQTLRPRTLTSSARIAPAGEPGTPLFIHGHVFQRDGRRPAPGIMVFAYHTDARGHYDVSSAGAHSWRLKGWATTDAEGAFEFQTIRPAPYPGRTTPSHVHVSIEGPGVQRRWVQELWFEDDDLVGHDARQSSVKNGKFGSVRPIRRRGETQHIDFNIRIVDEGRF